MKSRIACLLIVISFITLSCSEEGPAGPAGPAGPTGATGPQGPAGETGATGTANVIYGAWFTPEEYEVTTVYSMKKFTYTAEVPELTQEVLDNGVVLVYAKLIGYVASIWPAGQVGQLPITLTYTSGSTVYDTWSAFSTVGNLKIEFVNSGNIYSTINTSHQFRYIVIPGGVAASGGRLANNDETISRLRTMTYKEAMAFLGIPE